MSKLVYYIIGVYVFLFNILFIQDDSEVCKVEKKEDKKQSQITKEVGEKVSFPQYFRRLRHIKIKFKEGLNQEQIDEEISNIIKNHGTTFVKNICDKNLNQSISDSSYLIIPLPNNLTIDGDCKSEYVLQFSENNNDYNTVKKESEYIKTLEKNKNIDSVSAFFTKSSWPSISVPDKKDKELRIYTMITFVPLYSKDEKIKKEYDGDLKKAEEEIGKLGFKEHIGEDVHSVRVFSKEYIKSSKKYNEVTKEEIENIIGNYLIAKMIMNINITISSPAQDQDLCELAEQLPDDGEFDSKSSMKVSMRKCETHVK